MKYITGILIIVLLQCNLYSQELIPLNNLNEVGALRDSKKGKVILVNFWATWCVPCVKEFPDLIKLYNNYKEKDFEIIFISADLPEDAETKVKPFLKKNRVEFSTYYNNFENIDELINYFDKDWSGSIPATYIYNKDGKLTSSFVGMKGYGAFENEVKKNIN